MTNGRTRVTHFPGGEGGFVESKMMIYRTNIGKEAWGRQYGEIYRFLRAAEDVEAEKKGPFWVVLVFGRAK